MRPTRPILVIALALAGVFAACGGGSETDPVVVAASTDREPPASTLLDDDGNAMPTDPAAVPADAGARTEKGRYATARQAALLERALGPRALVMDVGCCAAQSVEQTLGDALALQAARALPDSAPVLVRGADLRLAAAAVDRLVALGHANVWLVTQ